MNEMSLYGRALITSFMAHQKCRCEMLALQDSSMKCVRCQSLDEIKKAWPNEYTSVLEAIVARKS